MADWHLERRINDALKNAYGDNQNEVDSLMERLPNFFNVSPDTQNAWKTGLDEYVPKLSKKTIEELVSARLEGYKRAIARGFGIRINKNAKKRELQEYLEIIFDKNGLYFLKQDIRERRNKLLAYAAILAMTDGDNRVAQSVYVFAEAVQSLLSNYNNLLVEQGIYAKSIGTGVKSSVVKNIEQTRENLKNIKIREPIIREAIEKLIDNSYSLSQSIMMTFYYGIVVPVILSRNARDLDLNEVEVTRVVIGSQIKDYPNFARLEPDIKEFYLGKKTVPELVREAKV